MPMPMPGHPPRKASAELEYVCRPPSPSACALLPGLFPNADDAHKAALEAYCLNWEMSASAFDEAMAVAHSWGPSEGTPNCVKMEDGELSCL